MLNALCILGGLGFIALMLGFLFIVGCIMAAMLKEAYDIWQFNRRNAAWLAEGKQLNR